MAESTSEYTAAREAAAFLPLPDRGVLAVTGPHRVKFLHNLLSNDIAALKAGQGCPAALMDVKGHQIAWMRVLVTEDAVLLEAGAGRLQTVQDQLLHYKVGTPVRWAERPTSVIAVLGPRAAEILSAAEPWPAESHKEYELGGIKLRMARAGDVPAAGFVVHAGPGEADALGAALRQAGAVAIGRETLDLLRIEEGRPWYGADVTAQNLLHETGRLAEYHSFSKGCYVGQEVIARLEGRGGHVSRQLRGLRLGAPAHAGDAVVAGGKDIGRITTAGVSPRLGPIALAYVHRSHFEPDTAVEVGGAPATVVELPFED